MKTNAKHRLYTAACKSRFALICDECNDKILVPQNIKAPEWWKEMGERAIETGWVVTKVRGAYHVVCPQCAGHPPPPDDPTIGALRIVG